MSRNRPTSSRYCLLLQVFYIRSLREQYGPRLWRLNSGDGGIPLVVLQTSNVWANIVTSLVLFLSPAAELRVDDLDGVEDGEMFDEWGQMVDELGGVYCGVYERCSHSETAVIFVSLVNSTGTGSAHLQTSFIYIFN